MYDNGFDNDKLPLLYQENINANIAVKTKTGTSKSININEIIMQGTVWGSLMFVGTMDKLGKLANSMPDILYKYHGIPIPPLCMVDDILTVSNVENTSEMNSSINTFIEHKKLKMSQKKCARIHVGKGHSQCPKLKVHKEEMKDSDSEKYLGDMINDKGTIQETIDKRKAKGDGIVADILSIISEIPLGKYKVPVALKLREAMLLNGMLFNSEVWHGVTIAQIEKLESVDEALLRGIMKAHCKTPKEFLYLETGCVPLRWVLAQRRINYARLILRRKDGDLVKSVFLAQKESPTKGDFFLLLEKDLKDLELTYNQAIEGDILKKTIKLHAKESAFKYLIDKQNSHKKVKYIRYEELQCQAYLSSELLTHEETQVLTATRSQCLR